MAKPDADQPVRVHIETLVGEEHKLLNNKTRSDEDHQRLEAIKVELDQCWDLLRQRRALREFGDDPDFARVRAAKVVEEYEQ